MNYSGLKTFPLAVAFLLASCHSAPQTVENRSMLTAVQNSSQNLEIKDTEGWRFAPRATVKIEPQPLDVALPLSEPKARVTLDITMPSLPLADFQTQALAVNTIRQLRLTLSGPGIPTPLLADGADGNGRVSNVGGTFSVSFSNVPYGAARRISLEAYDVGNTLIPGTTIKTAFAVGAASTPVELSFRTTPLADVLASITGSPAKQFLAENLDLVALQGFIDTLTGLGNSAPNYTYTTHPTLIVGSAIGADLITNQGNIAALNSANPAYKLTPGSVSYTLSGLINPDLATVVIRDPASGEVLGQTNGNGSISGVRPGSWQLQATAPGYTANNSPVVVVNAGANTNAGTISFSVANTPSISAINTTQGTIGSEVTLTGSNFHNSIAGNLVDFSGTVATIVSASPTQLVLTVPGGISGNTNIRVSVGGNVSNLQAFAVTPKINSLSVNSGVVGSNVIVSGTGFSAILGNNTVLLNGVPATINSATGTALDILIPQASNGNVTVQVGTQTSNGIAFNVLPSLSLTAPAANAVLSGTVPLTVSSSSGNAITKLEYFSGANKLGESTVAPYTFNWDTTIASSGPHSLTAKITDAANNTATSSAIGVSVNQMPVITTLSSSLDPLPGVAHTTQLTCNATDAESTPTLSWSTVGGDFGGFSSTTGNTVYWTAPASAGSPYVIRCQASDGTHTVSQDLSLNVLSNTGSINGSGGLF